MAVLMPNGKQQFFYTNGLPLVGGKVFTYAAGTTTPKATFSDSAGAVPNSNPIILDSRGEALVYWTGSYKIVLQDALGNTLYTVDNYVTDPAAIAAAALAASNAALQSTGGAALIGVAAGGTLEARLSYVPVKALQYGSSYNEIVVPVTVNQFIDNVLTIGNQSTDGSIYGNAAIRFIDSARTERGAVGYSRNGAIQPNGFYKNLLYCEVGNAFTADVQDTDFAVVVTHGATAANFPSTSLKAIEVIASTGDIRLRTQGSGVVTSQNDFYVGDIGAPRLTVGNMATTRQRGREYEIADQYAHTTNVQNMVAGGSIVKDNTSAASWKMSYGGGYDNYKISRCGVGATAWSDFVTISAVGNIMIGQSSTAPGSDGLLAVTGISTFRQTGVNYAGIFYNTLTTGDNLLIGFATEGTYTLRGSVTFNRTGGLTAYNTTSDYRAKTVNGPVTGALDKLSRLKPSTGRMHGASADIDMFIAHELAEVVPSAVTGEKDAVNDKGEPIYQMVDKSAIVPVLVAALQELNAKFNAYVLAHP